MAEETNIEWADHTWSPWVGCARISPACDACYSAVLMDDRMHRAQWGGPGAGVGTRSKMADAYWAKPITWNAVAARDGTRPFVFPSLCDPFDNHPDVEPWRMEWADLIRATPRLIWLLLTKRVGNALAMLKRMFPEGVPENVWLGVTVVNQEEADRDIPKAAETKRLLGIEKLFLSMEPLLGAVDLTALLWHPCPNSLDGLPTDWATGAQECCSRCDYTGISDELAVDWVIAGHETDQGKYQARISYPGWGISIERQCREAGVLFLWKQNGEYLDEMALVDMGIDLRTLPKHRVKTLDGVLYGKVGKKVAGRLLAGVEHNGRPVA